MERPKKFFEKAQFVIFRCQKYVKEGYIEIGKKNYLELLSVPGRSIFHYYHRVGPTNLTYDSNH